MRALRRTATCQQDPTQQQCFGSICRSSWGFVPTCHARTYANLRGAPEQPCSVVGSFVLKLDCSFDSHQKTVSTQSECIHQCPQVCTLTPHQHPAVEPQQVLGGEELLVTEQNAATAATRAHW
eukprot:5672339-Amphidinium_carterae.1